MFLQPGVHSDSTESCRSVAERVRLAEEKKFGATKVMLTSSQSFNYPSRGRWTFYIGILTVEDSLIILSNWDNVHIYINLHVKTWNSDLTHSDGIGDGRLV